MSSTSQTPTHLQYRNGTYYGQISSSYQRNGKGLLILDTSTIIFADWKNNQIQGMYIYMTEGIRAYGSMTGGKIDGFNVITMIGSGKTGQYQQSDRVRTFYGMFRSDKMYGKCILIDNDNILVTQYNNNQLQQIISRRSLKQRQLFQILTSTFPQHPYTLDQHLTLFIKQYISQIQQFQQITRYQPCINFFSKQGQYKFYGFQQTTKPNKKFGLLMRCENQLISVGEHNNSQLEGIGRLYSREGHIIDGAWRNGQVDGIGVDFNKQTNKFVLQINDGNQVRVENGFGFPMREILQFRKEFHLRSIYFYNDMAVLGLRSRFDSLINHIFQNPKKNIQSREYIKDTNYDRQRRFVGGSRTPPKRIQNYSPLRQRLSKYEMQSDYIEDHSPIKNRPINEYRPVDRSSTYFREDNRQRTDSRFNKGSQEYYEPQNAQFHNTYDGNNRGSYHHQNQNIPQNTSSNRSYDRIPANQRFSTQKSKSRNKFQQRQARQQQTYKQILKSSSSINNPYSSTSSPYRQSVSKGFIPSQDQQYGSGPSYQRPNTNIRGHGTSEQYSRQINNYMNRNDQNDNFGQNRSRKHTKDLVRELQTQEKQRRLTLDQIYEKSGLYGRNKRR